MRVNPTAAAGPVIIKHVRNTVPKAPTGTAPRAFNQASVTMGSPSTKSNREIRTSPRRTGKSLLAQQLSELELPVL